MMGGLTRMKKPRCGIGLGMSRGCTIHVFQKDKR
jgi:hypothetical protein